MADEINKTTLNNDSSDGGVEDVSPDTNPAASGPDGSSDDESGLAAEMGIDLSTLPEDGRGVVEETIARVENFLHEQRTNDSLALTAAQDKAQAYDAMVADPRIRAVMSGGPMPMSQNAVQAQAQQDTGADPGAIDPAGMERAIEEGPASLAKFLGKVMQDISTSTAQTTIAPVQQSTQALMQVQAMDTKYPDWRNHANELQKVINMYPQGGISLEQAYERHVLIPALRNRAEKAERRTSLTKQTKKNQLAGDTGGQNSGPTKSVSKVFDNEKDAIIAALESVEAGNI